MYSFLLQIVIGKPFGTNPAPDILVLILLVIFGIIFPVWFIVMRLENPGPPDLPPVSVVPPTSPMAGIPPCHHCQSGGRYPPAYPGIWGAGESGSGGRG